MTNYHVIISDSQGFTHVFYGEPQIKLTFEHDDAVYRIVTRAHDEHTDTPIVHAEVI